MVQATNQGMFTNQSSTPSSGFVYVIGNRTFNTAEEAKQYLARNPGAGTISRVPFQNVTAPTISTGLLTPSTSTSTTDPYKYTQYQTDGIVPPNMSGDTITPSPTGDVIVKEEPTTTTQTEPTGTPTSDPTKTQPGESGPYDPNAGTTANIEDPGPKIEYSIEDIIEIIRAFPQFSVEDPTAGGSSRESALARELQLFLETVELYQNGEISWQQMSASTPSNLLEDEEFAEHYNVLMSSFEAEEIVNALETDPERLSEFEELQFPQTEQIITNSAMTFAGVTPTTPVTTTTIPGGSTGIVIRGGAGVTIDIGQILQRGGDLEDILNGIKGYIPGVSLPNWMPTAGVIFLPTVGQAINKVNDIAGQIGDAIESGESVGDVLNQIGAIVVQEAEVLSSELEGQWTVLTNTIKDIFTKPKTDDDGNIIYETDEDGNIVRDEDGNPVPEREVDPTGVSGVLAGVITGSYPDLLPSWMPDLLGGILIENLPNVYSAVRNILIQSGATTEELFPPLEEEIVTEQDPTLLFTNRGNNYFVSSEGDEYFQLAESEDFDFEFNGQYTREQLENTGLETINSGTYQSLLDDLSFHALEEDIYQYSIEDLVARYEEEGGVLPGDWKLMDEESQYNYFLDDYFDIPRTIEDPDKDDLPGEVEPPVEPPPTDEPEPEPEPPTDEPEPEPTPTDIERLFADFLAQIDEEFTGQIEQVNQIIQNFVETLPDFDAMPTMEDIAEYFEINGVTLSEQNFDRIRQELADAGYLTQEQLTEALAGVATPEQVQQAIEGAGFATPEQVIQALAEAGYATPDDITNALANSGFVTEDRMLQALAEAGYATPEQVEQIVNNAISGIVIPEGATAEEVRQLIQEAIDGIPEGISLEDVGNVVNEAIANIEFPEGLSEGDVRGIVDSFGFATSADVQAGFDDLNDKIDNVLNGVATQFTEQEAAFAADLLGLETSVFQQLAATEGALRDELLGLGEDLDSIRTDFSGRFDEFADTFTAFQTDVSGQFDTLNNKIDDAVNGLSIQLTEQEATFLEELTGVEASVLQQLAATEGGLRSELESLGFNLTEFQSDVAGRFDQFEDTFALFQTDVGEQFADLNQRFDDAVNGIATQFSNQEAEFLASITGLEASFIQSLAAVEGGLSGELEMLGTDLISLQEDVAGRFDEFEQTVGQQLTQAEQDRSRIEQSLQNALALQAQGQLRALTEAEARLLAEITGGNAEILQELSTQTGGLQQQLSDLGFNITDVESRLGEQITTGLSQAQQDRLRIEQGLYNALQLQSQGQAVELDEAEARLLAEITGGDAAILQEMSSQTGALENQLSSLGLNLTEVQQNLSQDISDLQAFTGFGFSEAAQQRQNLQQALIAANADITQLSSDMFAQFQAQDENVEELFEGTNVNIEALRQGQISQSEAFAQYAQSTDVRLGLGEQQREEILTRQADFERMYGEEQQALQQQIMGGNVLTALAAGGMFAAPAAPTRAPYEEFMKGITYRPREAPQLAIKTPAVDYNEEAQKLLMRTRRRGMLV